jgi:hypothetical protein
MSSAERVCTSLKHQPQLKSILEILNFSYKPEKSLFPLANALGYETKLLCMINRTQGPLSLRLYLFVKSIFLFDLSS